MDLLGPGKWPETWVAISTERQPASWKGIQDPVRPLLVSFYGHPQAGLLWLKHCQHRLYAEGFERVSNWECLYVHRKEKLFSNVYVDDFHLAGNKEAVPNMMERLEERIALEPAEPFDGNSYLGCKQVNVPVDPDMVIQKRMLF